MVEDKGIEPAQASEQKSFNSRTNVAQNSAQLNTNKCKASPIDDKIIPPPGQEKHAFLHSKRAISVHQNFFPLSPELELIIKAWPSLRQKVRDKIMGIILQGEGT